MLLRGMDCSEKVGKKSCVQGVAWNILKMIPIVPCIKSHLTCKFHENPFHCFSVMLLTDRQTHRQTDRATDNDENITFAMAEVTMSCSRAWYNMITISYNIYYINWIFCTVDGVWSHFNPYTTGNAWVHNQHCGYCFPGAKAPGHQYPQCWLTVYCIESVSYKNATFAVD